MYMKKNGNQHAMKQNMIRPGDNSIEFNRRIFYHFIIKYVMI